MNTILNVGGGEYRELPSIYKGWEQKLLDIDPNVKPDIVCDAKEMRRLPKAKYDAVYCSHTLEHFYKHEVLIVLAGFTHVLRPNGFAHIIVPDLQILFEVIVKGNQDIGETWYMAGSNPITFHDVLYGWTRMITAGNTYYAHKTGFTAKSLSKVLRATGFMKVLVATDGMGNLNAFAFKQKPSSDTMRRLGCL